jgi:hypothetical protein
MEPILELEYQRESRHSLDFKIHNGLLYELAFEGLAVYDFGGVDYPESLGAVNLCEEILPFVQIAVCGEYVFYSAMELGLYLLRYSGPMPINTGDANGNGVFNGLDVVYLVAYLKGGTPPAEPRERGDANGDCTVNGLDVTYLVQYFKGHGQEPIRAFCYGQ